MFVSTRAITRLDGARGRKQVWRPYVRSWGLLEANLLYWRKCMWHCWDFSAPSAVIRRPLQWFDTPCSDSPPHCDSAPGKLCPLSPLVTPQVSTRTWWRSQSKTFGSRIFCLKRATVFCFGHRHSKQKWQETLEIWGNGPSGT